MAYRSRRINPELLQAELDKRNLSGSGASIGIGYSHTLISSAKHTGILSEPAVILLKQTYNIQPESYCISDTPPQPQSDDVADYTMELKSIRGDIKELTQAIEDMTYAIRLVSGHVAEIKHALGVEEKFEDE